VDAAARAPPATARYAHGMSAISLIGMPGAGKSTIGVLLAKTLGLDFVDTDLVIQVRQGRTLEQILADDGYLALRAIEAEVLLDIEPRDAVVATGGSAVYSEAAMHHLARFGPIVYLQAKVDTLVRRVPTLRGRGIAAAPGTTLEALAAERVPLYERYANIAVGVDLPRPEDVVQLICERLRALE
jgi:shikimate kinase